MGYGRMYDGSLLSQFRLTMQPESGGGCMEEVWECSQAFLRFPRVTLSKLPCFGAPRICGSGLAEALSARPRSTLQPRKSLCPGKSDQLLSPVSERLNTV